MFRRDIDGRQCAGAKRLDARKRSARAVAALAAGTDPDRAGIADHRQKGRSQTAGQWLIRLCPRNAV